MNNEEYQSLTHRTNEYPQDKMLECLVLVLCSEAGEVAGILKKAHRGDHYTKGTRLLLRAEVSDCLWYISELCTLLDFDISSVMAYNIYKLKTRKANGTIKGSGDDR